MKPRTLKYGHDYVSITICVSKDDIEPEILRLHVRERNNTLDKGRGAEWGSTCSVPLQYARIGQSLFMSIFTEHVMEYAQEPL